MWREEPWFATAQRTLQDTADFAVAGLNPFIPFHGIRIGLMLTAGPLQSDLMALSYAPNAEALYNLSPVAAMLSDRSLLDPDRVSASKISLRLGTVSLQTGRLRLVTESGALLERDGTPIVGPPTQIPAACAAQAKDRDDAHAKAAEAEQMYKDAVADHSPNLPAIRVTRDKANRAAADADMALATCLKASPSPPVPVRVDLASAVLASSSIPMYFPTVLLAQGDHYVDGGVRELVPIQAALDAGATEVYAICASGAGVRPDPTFASPFYEQPRGLDHPRLVSLLLRTIDVWLDETLVNDLQDRRTWPANGVFVIAPTLSPELHDIMTIEPGMIDIGAAYGYMRAWDAVVGAKRPDGPALASLTDQIIDERRAAWELEFYANAQRPVPFTARRGETLHPAPNPSALLQLREHKRRLGSLIRDRLARGGAVPIDRDWWTEQWERHAWDPLTDSPWDAFAFVDPVAGPAAPPMGEDAPAAAAFPDGQLELVGVGTDHALYRRETTGSQWSPGWDGLGGNFTSSPAIAAWADARLEVFARGTDRQLYHGSWRQKTLLQGNWESLGGALRSRPSVVAWDPTRLDLFALGADRRLIHKAWDGRAWRPSLRTML